MEIHTYRAASLQEALMLVRHELGPEASVLQTREVGGRFFGLLGKRFIEVEASRDAHAVRRVLGSQDSTQHETHSQDIHDTTHPATSDASDAQHGQEYAHAGAGTLASKSNNASNNVSNSALKSGLNSGLNSNSMHSARVRPSEVHSTGFDLTEDEPSAAGLIELSDTDDEPSSEATHLRSLDGSQSKFGHRAGHGDAVRSAAATISSEPRNYLSPAMFEVFTELLDADVDPDVARTMLQEMAMHASPDQLGDPWLIKGRLCQWIQQRIHVAGAIELSRGQQEIVALVGPTGVGKTTTLAKLAAGFHFDQGASVGFITLDTFRLGAIDQLQKYADLLGAPCEVVKSPDQMVPAIERLAHCQLILIDTAGRSPRDESQLAVLGDFLRAAAPTQVHLVLSAASSQSHAELALEQFSHLAPTHLLLTKLDEATCLGSWYRLLSTGHWPLSYLTTGQHVPEDILVANRRRVASLILGQSHTLPKS